MSAPAAQVPTTFTVEQAHVVQGLICDLKEQLASKPKRFTHSLGVAGTAYELANLYGADPYDAYVAGLLHDWDKAVPAADLVSRAKGLGIDLGVDYSLVEPLLHGMVAARELPALYPWLSQDILHAIAVHTTAAAQMSSLDMVLFVADGIEPNRKASPGIQKTRDLVGKVSLEDLFWDSFSAGVVYVIETNRYLWPGTIDIYNSWVQDRARS